jgi:hypothetical protein
VRKERKKLRRGEGERITERDDGKERERERETEIWRKN